MSMSYASNPDWMQTDEQNNYKHSENVMLSYNYTVIAISGNAFAWK